MRAKQINSDQNYQANTLIADNLIELSNIQYLLNYVNFIEPDHQEMFVRCLERAQNMDKSRAIEVKLKGRLELMPYNEFKIDDSIIKQQAFESIIRRQVRKSFSTKTVTRPLSKQQLLQMGQIKINQQKERQERQITRSRRSFEYIQSLRNKISNSIEKEQDWEQQVEKNKLQVNEMLELIGKLEQERCAVKMQLFYLQKEEGAVLRKLSLCKQLEHNLINARRLYTQCMAQSRISSITKSSLLHHQTSLDRSAYKTSRQFVPREREKERIAQLEKLLNSILIDERELSLIYSEIQMQ